MQEAVRPTSVIASLLLFVAAPVAEVCADSPTGPAFSSPEPAEDDLETPARVTELSATEVLRYTGAALEGNGEAAFRLATFYSMNRMDMRNAGYWAQISAENGYFEGMALHTRIS